MVVDCHTHVKFDELQDAGVSEHIEAAQVVDKCVVLATYPSSNVVIGDGEHSRTTADGSSEQANVHLSEYIEKYHEKMVGFALVDPINDGVSVKHLKSATEKLGLKGIVLYCCACGFHPAHSRAMQLYDSAQQLMLPVFFHNTSVGPGGVLEYAQPFLLDEVARTFPSLKIIVGNMGFPFYEQTMCLLAKHQNVFADLSVRPGNPWQVYNVVAAAYDQQVMDKLLFGSAFPAAKARDCIETLLGFNKLLSGANLPTVPRANMQGIIERESLKILGIEQ